MRHDRKLSLRAERLAELGAGDLAHVAAAGVPTLPADACLTWRACQWTRNVNCLTHTCA